MSCAAEVVDQPHNNLFIMGDIAAVHLPDCVSNLAEHCRHDS